MGIDRFIDNMKLSLALQAFQITSQIKMSHGFPVEKGQYTRNT
jgi:hypothetical protein